MADSPKSEFEYDFPDFSEEDFACIDALTSSHFDPQTSKGNPQVRVEMAADDQKRYEVLLSVPATSVNGHGKPPIEAHRRNCILSVTDLVSPSWCEVQFDYGLRQKRSIPLEFRPKSFLSASGKEISVEKQIAVRNDAVTKQGKAVHKELEEELGLKEVKVKITSQEERWALRLLNLIAGVRAILVFGFTRELPVFGIVHDQIVVGVIDEVTRSLHPKSKRNPSTPEFDDPKKLNERTTQSHIEDFFALQRNPKKKDVEEHLYTLVITDTKTRRTDSLPSDDDALPSRLQLMLYHRLLSDLLSEYPPFDFSSLWVRLGLSPDTLFSTQFLVDADLVTDSQQERTACLDDLANYWLRTVRELDIVGVDSELRLVYRLQPESSRRKRGATRKPGTFLPPMTSQEDHDLARAIEASLQDINGCQEEERETVQGDNSHSELQEAMPNKVEADGSDDTEDSHIIGIKHFIYDEDILTRHVTGVLEWWYGKRKPRGVPVHLSRRCFTCEYYTDCEWREEKAREFSKSVEERRSAQASPPPDNYVQGYHNSGASLVGKQNSMNEGADCAT